MDPDANLKEQLELAAAIQAVIPEGQRNEGLPQMTVDDMVVAAERLAELIEAMDEWISKGGFLPLQWAQSGDCAQCKASGSVTCCQCGAYQ